MAAAPRAEPRGAGTGLLVLNAGSSSLKFCRFALEEAGDPAEVERGRIAGIEALPEWLRDRFAGRRPRGVGHRVVHGGTRHTGPIVVTPEVLEDLRALVPLAPLHQPANLAVIDAVSEALPGVPQVACFDTSFHRGRAPVSTLVPLPREIRDAGVERYGFHGLSYEYVASVLPRVAPGAARGRVIVAHLGSGASLCALREGRSVDTTFGFTPLDGLCMGTRPGSLDPGVVLHLFQGLGMTATQVETMLYRASGLLGISGVSGDMRTLLESDLAEARLAVDYFVYRATREIGGLAGVLGGLDGLVFTAGIGENSAEIRRRILEACAWLGVALDPDANRRGGPLLTTPGSRVPAWVVPTDEELMIARHTAGLLGR